MARHHYRLARLQQLQRALRSVLLQRFPAVRQELRQQVALEALPALPVAHLKLQRFARWAYYLCCFRHDYCCDYDDCVRALFDHHQNYFLNLN